MASCGCHTSEKRRSLGTGIKPRRTPPAAAPGPRAHWPFSEHSLVLSDVTRYQTFLNVWRGENKDFYKLRQF